MGHDVNAKWVPECAWIGLADVVVNGVAGKSTHNSEREYQTQREREIGRERGRLTCSQRKRNVTTNKATLRLSRNVLRRRRQRGVGATANDFSCCCLLLLLLVFARPVLTSLMTSLKYTDNCHCIMLNEHWFRDVLKGFSPRGRFFVVCFTLSLLFMCVAAQWAAATATSAATRPRRRRRRRQQQQTDTTSSAERKRKTDYGELAAANLNCYCLCFWLC